MSRSYRSLRSQEGLGSKHLAQTQQRIIQRPRTRKRCSYLCTLCPGHEGLADVPHIEHRRGLDIIPILLRKRIDAARKTNEQEATSTPMRHGNQERKEEGRTRRVGGEVNSRLLLGSLLPLGDALVLTYGHGWRCSRRSAAAAARERWKRRGETLSPDRPGELLYTRGGLRVLAFDRTVGFGAPLDGRLRCVKAHSSHLWTAHFSDPGMLLGPCCILTFSRSKNHFLQIRWHISENKLSIGYS